MNFKTVQTDKLVSFVGELRFLAQTEGWKQRVELWLLNNETNRNNWRYENLELHRRLFAETPILVAYVNGKIGDGHNFEEIKGADGSVTASFMASTAERIVGFFKNDEDIRLEEKDGKTWIVGTGYIWKWYAQELVKKLKKQGLEGMPVSIETLVDEMHYDGTTEVYTKYQILGTTILGLDVEPAVADANIKALSAIGVNELHKMTLRVASEQSKAQSPQKTKKGVKTTMRIKELGKLFPDFKVLAANGNHVALLSSKGAPCIATVEKDGENVKASDVEEIKANAVFGDGENSVEVALNAITDALYKKCAELDEKLSSETAARESAETELCEMKKAEKARRIQAVKDAITAKVAEIKENFGSDFEADNCDDLLTDEKVAEFAEMTNKDGEFCGDVEACKEVAARNMDLQVKAHAEKKIKENSRFAWEASHDDNHTVEKGIDSSIANILK